MRQKMFNSSMSSQFDTYIFFFFFLHLVYLKHVWLTGLCSAPPAGPCSAPEDAKWKSLGGGLCERLGLYTLRGGEVQNCTGVYTPSINSLTCKTNKLVNIWLKLIN